MHAYSIWHGIAIHLVSNFIRITTRRVFKHGESFIFKQTFVNNYKETHVTFTYKGGGRDDLGDGRLLWRKY